MKKIIVSCILFILLSACTKSNETENNHYLSCNATSNSNMIETELGYYYVYDSIIYYADKSDLNNWVAVCNKPNCMHQSMSCNAYLDVFSGITPKDGKIYGVGISIKENPYVYEIAKDGSGKKKVYDIPFGDGVNVTTFKGMLFQNQLIIYYGYLAENGMYHYNLARLEEDGSLNLIYTEVLESESGNANLSATSVGVRGKKAILSTFLTKTDGNFLNVLWKVDGEKPERVNIPVDIDISWGYLAEESFTYFKEKEGFYKVDLLTGEQELIMENQLEDSKGIVLTEKYLIEMNRYRGYTPEEAYLKFYNGTEWLNVELPEEVKKSDKLFTVLSVASDRIFMAQLTQESDDYRSDIYYFLLEDDTPKLIHCDDVSRCGERSEEESKEETTEQETIEYDENTFETITVFDNEDFLFQITGFYRNEKNRLCIKTYWENKSNKADYDVLCKYATVNGLMCYINQGMDINANERWEDSTSNDEFELRFDKVNMPESMIQYNFTDKHWFEIKEIYLPEEYTDIALYLHVSEGFNTIIEDEVVHIYPYGKENAIQYTREIEDTDNVLIDNEYVTILVRGYEDGIITNGNVKFYFVNKTDQRIQISIDELYVNGFPLKNDLYTRWLYQVVVNEDCSAFHTLSSNYFSNSITEHGIKNIEELKMLLRVYPVDYFESQTGEDLVNGIFTLNP